MTEITVTGINDRTTVGGEPQTTVFYTENGNMKTAMGFDPKIAATAASIKLLWGVGATPEVSIGVTEQGALESLEYTMNPPPA